MTVTLTNNTSDTITAVGTGDANASINKYNVGAHYVQSGNEWNIDGFYLVDENGSVYERVGATSKWTSGQVCEVGNNCAIADAVKYLASGAATYGLNSYGAVDFDSNYDADNNSGNGNSVETFSAAAGFFKLYNGPVLNPYFKCSLEPFYVDLNSDGDLGCNANDNAAVTDVSFSDRWEYDRWVSKPGNSNAASPLISRENGYAFGDPVGTKKLLTTAFSGWFDGAHTMSTSTNLNALQAFSLVILFFTEGSDGQRVIPNVSGLPAGANNMFYVESPMFMEEGGSADFNLYIGNALNNFHQ